MRWRPDLPNPPHQLEPDPQRHTQSTDLNQDTSYALRLVSRYDADYRARHPVDPNATPHVSSHQCYFPVRLRASVLKMIGADTGQTDVDVLQETGAHHILRPRCSWRLAHRY